ncbi:MAG: hypothetical protein JJU03_06020 [Idiomarina sp.]|nr:hypothetical protein [Idiomarina sp.]
MTALPANPASTDLYTAADGYPLALAGLQGIEYAAALLTHSARLYPFAPAYLQAQLSELSGPCRRSKLNHLALSCLLLAQHQQAGKDPQQTLAVLANHPDYRHAAEFIARALINNRYLQQQRHANGLLHPADAAADLYSWKLPFALPNNIRPVPASLMRALLQWPDNDKLFNQALGMLQRQPALASLVCRYATAYTPQGKQLELKPSLLLLGPQRSRELVLLAHFESNLSKPVFPLRATLLKRRTLIQHALHRLAQTFAVALPGRAELIAWLVVYDAWRSPRWTSRAQLHSDSQQPPWRVAGWLGNTSPADHRVALRLCQYWRMPQALSDALRLEHPDPSVNALIALSISAVSVIDNAANIHLQNAGNHQTHEHLASWLAMLNADSAEAALERYLEAVSRAATDAHYSSELPASMRP